MDCTYVYMDVDPEKLLRNGDAVRIVRKMKLAGEEACFHFTESRIMGYFGDEKDEMANLGLLIRRLEQFGIVDCLQEFIVRYPNGDMEDLLELRKKHQDKLDKLGWLDKDGKIIPLNTEEELKKIQAKKAKKKKATKTTKVTESD